MTQLKNVGTVVSDDYVRNNNMHDEEDVFIYASLPDSDECQHVIMLTIWRKEGEFAHTFAYAVDEDDCLETRETATWPLDLIEELPEQLQKDARIAVSAWISFAYKNPTLPRLCIATMTTTPYSVTGVSWGGTGHSLPADVTLNVPDWLTALGIEDFEPDGSTDLLEDDEDWDDYEPSVDAHRAFEAKWDLTLRDLLTSQFGHPVLDIGGYRPL